MPAAGNYVCAGVDTFLQLMERFIDTQPGFFDDAKLNNMLHNSINSFLYSFGTGVNYKSKRLSKNHVAKFINCVDRINVRPFMANTKMYWDSGGFQIANGGLYTKDMPSFINLYYDLIAQERQKYTNAFILDLPPGPGSKEIFTSYQEVENINRLSYQRAQQLPQDVKDKIIYIHHFRTPELFSSYMKFLNEGLADGYSYYGTGGIVAGMASDVRIPIIIYAIPLACILKYAKDKGLKKVKFHVLGGANFRDVFCHQMFERHVKEYHGIDLTITYDSSAIFKGLAIGRYVQTFTPWDEIVKMDIRSKNLPLRFRQHNITVEDNVYKICNEMAEKYNFKPLNKTDNPIYDPVTNTLARDVHMYLISYVFTMFHRVEELSRTIVDEAYNAYKEFSDDEWNGDWQFNDICYKFTRLVNQGKATTKQRKKSTLFDTLKFLEKLDMDKCEQIVADHMSGDDISFKENILRF